MLPAAKKVFNHYHYGLYIIRNIIKKLSNNGLNVILEVSVIKKRTKNLLVIIS